MSSQTNPFHACELEAQRRAGVEDIAASSRGFIRGHMPEQHRAFFAALPFLVIAAGDAEGRPWVSILEGAEGFASSPDPGTLALDTSLAADDPLADSLVPDRPVGLLGIELATRRRNRLNGRLTATTGGYTVAVSQSFGNCPQYIREREWHRVKTGAARSRTSRRLDDAQAERIAAADTFFIGSGHRAEGDGAANGFDASHRGGPPGFVRVEDGGVLSFPDYPGNNFFNTIGNLLGDPRVGLLFIDFESGGLLHISGRARIDWEPAARHDPDARRMIRVEIDRVIDRPGVLALRWRRPEGIGSPLKVIDKVRESETITSFVLAAPDGAPLQPFQAGQYLPIRLDPPHQAARVERSYSLSGDPAAPTYRISVKREETGIASRFLHDAVEIGDLVEAGAPSGDFVVPPGQGPVVLVSAGVGITPMLSMLHAILRAEPDRPVWFVHGARNQRHRAFAREVDDLIGRAPQALSKTYFSAPKEGGDDRTPYSVGRITADDLIELTGDVDCDYMLCGPTRFIGDVRSGLEASGVPSERIHFETFGPAG